MGFVSWAVVLLVALIVLVATMATIALVGATFQITIPEWITVLIGLLMAFLVAGPWATNAVFDLINRHTSPKWQLHLQKRPIRSEYKVFRDGEERDIRWERGWRIWLLYVIIAAFWIYAVFFAGITLG